jgi:hypothetical protein
MIDNSDSPAAPTDLRAFFDDYVHRVFPERRNKAGADWPWPGDEWVDDGMREETYRRIVAGLPTDRVVQVVEIGPGSGKYTQLLLARTMAEIVAYELSDAFLDVLRQRFPSEIAAGRLSPRPMAWTDNEGLVRDYAAKLGQADLLFGIDVLYFMDFQSALVYLVSAAAMLRRGGRFYATFAEATSKSGWDRMVRDLGRHSAFDMGPCTRFHWVDQTLLEFVLPKLGFGNLTFEHGPDGGLDIARLYVGADLLDPSAGRGLLGALAPVGDSTNRRSN